MPGEKIIRIGKFHWIYSFVSLLWLAGFSGAGWGLRLFLMRFEWFYYLPPKQQMLPVIVFVAIGVLIFALRWLSKEMTYIYITDKRFLFKRGIFFIRTEKMAIREINYCETRQTLLGNILDYGEIYIYTLTLDDNNVVLPEIAKPHVFTSAIERVKKGARSQSMQDVPPEMISEQQREHPAQAD